LYLAFLDESDHTAKNDFTVCGLTIIPVEKIPKISTKILELRDKTGVFKAQDLLKFATGTKPKHCTHTVHQNLKEDVISTASLNDVMFLGYCKFNDAGAPHDADKNRLYGFNTLLGKFNEFLEEKSSHGIVQVDRLDFSRKTKKKYKDGFEYLKEKFQQGNEYSGSYRPLENILSYSMSCEGTSHLQSLNDILTGSLRYLANGTNPTARKALQAHLQHVLWKDKFGSFKENGFTLRPYDRTKLSVSVQAEYDALRTFLNTTP
jgi:hypothetical protein